MNRIVFAVSLSLAVGFVPTSAFADAAAIAPSGTSVPETSADDEGVGMPAQDKKICQMERKTGSKMSVRVCRTPTQIRAEREQSREAVIRGERSH